MDIVKRNNAKMRNVDQIKLMPTAKQTINAGAYNTLFP